MTKTSISLIVAGMLLGSSLFAAQANSTTSSASVSPIGNAGFQNSYGRNSNAPSNLQGVEVGGDDIVIPKHDDLPAPDAGMNIRQEVLLRYQPDTAPAAG